MSLPECNRRYRCRRRPPFAASARPPPEAWRQQPGSAGRSPRGAAARVSYEIVPGLISGVELSAGGRKLAWSIADYLAVLEKSVGEILESPRLAAVNE